jgi:hypothetical protein
MLDHFMLTEGTSGLPFPFENVSLIGPKPSPVQVVVLETLSLGAMLAGLYDTADVLVIANASIKENAQGVVDWNANKQRRAMLSNPHCR